MAGPIRISILGDSRDAVNALDKTGKAASSMGDKARAAGKMLAVGLAGAGIAVAAGLKDAISKASELSDSIAASQVILGSASKGVEKFADDAAKNFGISKQSAIDAANAIGNIGSKSGLAGKDLEKFTTDLIGRAGDAASMFGGTSAEAVEAFGSALRGEFEPIRKYGVLLNDATLKTEAMSMGIIKSTKESLTPQQKALVVQQAILKQTGKAQGDFEKTSGSLKNRQETLKAQFENTSAAIGMKLLPIAVKLMQFFTDKLVPAFGKIAEKAKEFWAQHGAKITEVFKKIGEFAKDAFAGLKQFWDEGLSKIDPIVVKALAVAVGALGIALLVMASPVTAIVLGIGLLVLAFGWLYKKFPIVREGVAKIGEGFNWLKEQVIMIWKNYLQPFFEWLGPVLVKLWTDYVKPYLTFVIELWKNVFGAIWTVAKFAFEQVMWAWNNILAPVFSVIGTVVKFLWDFVFKPVFTLIWNFVKIVFAGIVLAWDYILKPMFKVMATVFMFLWNNVVKPVFSGIKTTIATTIAVIKTVIETGISNFRKVWEGIKFLWEKAKEVVGKVVGFFKDLGKDIGNALSGAKDWLVNTGKQIIQGLLDGITGGFNKVKDKLGELTDLLPDWKGPASKDKNLLRESGNLIMDGLVLGISEKNKELKKTLSGVTDTIENGVGTATTLGGDIKYSGSVGSSGNAQQVVINVSVPVGADPVEVGRQTTKALRAYEESLSRPVTVSQWR